MIHYLRALAARLLGLFGGRRADHRQDRGFRPAEPRVRRAKRGQVARSRGAGSH